MVFLVEDLDFLLANSLKTTNLNRVRSSTDIRRLADAYETWSNSSEAKLDSLMWQSLPWEKAAEISTDLSGPAMLPSVTRVERALDRSTTEIFLRTLPQRALQPEFTLLGAFVGALSDWSGKDTHIVDVYSHSRDLVPEDLDVERTIGYIQSTWPAVITWPRKETPVTKAESVMLQISHIPARKFGFDALRFSKRSHGTPLKLLPTAQVRLNYRGQIERLERGEDTVLTKPIDIPTGPHRSPNQKERYLIMAEGDIVDGQLVFGIKYSKDLFLEKTIAKMVDSTIYHLQSLFEAIGK